ncbi:carboxymuconolactone decarboxylase family protein [Rubrobacter aplysinae]|uniref:hypothetical protein n=1 Tax=Rubrobacter aplysinae TaxID=909625 RepID=UPI00064C49EC|nr:hypothetical protein [Rubrobacter aplysinae]
MARIPIMHEDDPSTPRQTRELLGEIGERRGQVLNIYRAMANHPQLAKPFVEFYVTAREGGLTQAECELAYLSATVANDCHY